MPRKKDGMLFEVHPTPATGKDGKNIVYVRPLSGMKMTMKELEEVCSQDFGLRYGELSRAFGVFLQAASEKMADGMRIETPIGTFAPRLALTREITDPEDVKGSDVRLDGVDYNPGKIWNSRIAKWCTGFRCAKNANTQEIMSNQKRLDRVLQSCLSQEGYVTVGMFQRRSGLTYYSARKQLELWTKGDAPRLLKTKHGQEYIYTEV